MPLHQASTQPEITWAWPHQVSRTEINRDGRRRTRKKEHHKVGSGERGHRERERECVYLCVPCVHEEQKNMPCKSNIPNANETPLCVKLSPQRTEWTNPRLRQSRHTAADDQGCAPMLARSRLRCNIASACKCGRRKATAVHAFSPLFRWSWEKISYADTATPQIQVPI